MSSFTGRRSAAEGNNVNLKVSVPKKSKRSFFVSVITQFESSSTSGRTIAMETKEIGNNENRSELPVTDSDSCVTFEDEYPPGTTLLDCQVAGHLYDAKKNKIGMLRGANGRVLKSGEKPILQEREIAFYDKLENSEDPIYKEFALFTPKYFGTLESTYKNKPIKFLVLKDITEGMSEPCVMDVKIGSRTWDPLAGPEKREADARKYAASKKAYGFCIPGFQVYNLETSQLERFNKDYGKKLDAEGVVDALRIFLNATPGKPPCRELVVKLLSYLWKILALFRCQKKLRFYASSLLIVYDAQRLRNFIRMSSKDTRNCVINARGRTFSSCDTSLSGHLTENGLALERTAKSLSPLATNPLSSTTVKSHRKRAFDRLNRLKRSASLTGYDFASSSRTASPQRDEPTIERSGSFGRGLSDSFNSLCRTHSYTNNYDRDIMEMKEDYTLLLEELTGKSRERQNWVRVNMIDFTHVFDAEDDSLDTNYLEGIANLVKILETFLE